MALDSFLFYCLFDIKMSYNRKEYLYIIARKKKSWKMENFLKRYFKKFNLKKTSYYFRLINLKTISSMKIWLSTFSEKNPLKFPHKMNPPITTHSNSTNSFY